MAATLTDEQQALADATTACLATLFGEGAMEAWLAAALSGDLAAGCIKTLIVDCLTNPDTSPLSKEMLAEIIQGKDVDGNGVIGLVSDPEADDAPTTSSGIKVLTVSASIKKNVVK